VRQYANQILGMQLVTHQSGPQGQKVRRLLIEEGADIRKEYYVAALTDRATQTVAMMASSEGGMDIEEVAHKTPEKIIKVFVDPATGLTQAQGEELAKGVGMPADSAATFGDGWLHTGDIGRFDGEGRLYVTDRRKLMIISGGENIYCAEVERVCATFPGVRECIAYGMPDARLGERGCAFVVLRPGASLSLDELQVYMAECKVAKQYWPERVEVVADLPRTPSGKIQKFKIRDEMKTQLGLEETKTA
jgi:acyl-CoA synthetase (AMP-forming)/AMP-acid ligase II